MIELLLFIIEYCPNEQIQYLEKLKLVLIKIIKSEQQIYLFDIFKQSKRIRSKMNQKLESKNSLNNLKSVLKDRNPTDYIKMIKSMNFDEDLRKIKHFKEIQKSMKQQKQQITQIQQQLQKVERQIKEKKREVIQKQLQQIEEKKRQRQKFVIESNKIVSVVLQKNESKRKHMELIVKQVEQREQVRYKNTLKQRVNRYRNPIDFNEIRQHQSKYLNIKLSVELQTKKASQKQPNRNKRVKSQMGGKYENQFQHLSIGHKSILDERVRDQFTEKRMEGANKKIRAIRLMEKRNQYGNRVERQKKNSRLKTEDNSESKRQKQSKLFWEEVQLQNESKMKERKPKLNTNLPKIQLRECAILYLKKINQNRNLGALQKIMKLKRMQDSYVQRLNQNNPQAIDIISELSLLKADLYLNA